jgi:hypothetical protein
LTEDRVDTGRLIGRLATVVALIGGLLYTEPRLTPWLRAHRRVVSRVALGVLLLCIAALYEVWAIQANSVGQDQSVSTTGHQAKWENAPIVSGQDQSMSTTGHQENAVHGDSFDRISPTVAVEAMVVGMGSTERNLAARRRINTFFATDGMRAYQDFYGKVPDPNGYWVDLTPKQKANRKKVCDHAQLILDGAALVGDQISTEEALMRAHLEVAARGN